MRNLSFAELARLELETSLSLDSFRLLELSSLCFRVPAEMPIKNPPLTITAIINLNKERFKNKPGFGVVRVRFVRSLP